jgi:PAS domain S-box-containing protein
MEFAFGRRSDFLTEGGAMGARLRNHDWSNSPLGSPEGWSATLKTTVGLMLRAEAQIVLFWGDDFVALYNDAYAPTIGDKHPRAIGRPARENWAELWNDLGPLLEGVRRTGNSFVARDRAFYIERHGYGETVYFDVSYSAVPDEDGSVAGVLCIVSETTERVRAEAARRESEAKLRQLNDTLEERILDRTRELEHAHEALRQAQKMEAVGQLTGGIAHDFNNLLQGIVGSLDLIRRKPNDTNQVRSWSEAGLKAAERGARLTGQLLAFSRMQKLQIRPLDISKTVAGFVEMLHRSIGPTIRIQVDLNSEQEYVLGDQVQLEMAMPEGGELTIRTRMHEIAGDHELPDGKYVELSIADNGVGMPPSVVERAFEPFFTTKEVGKGTGLGLSQVYGAVIQSGGSVRIESAVGIGTTVRLFLRSTRAVQSEAAEQTAGDQFYGRTATIMVVDDDPVVRSFLSESLAALGYRGIVEENGASALAEFDRVDPDALILDFAMPGMNGAEVARKARRRRPDLPIIFASGYSETAAVKEVMGKHCRLLQKPFKIHELQSMLDELLQESERS